MTKKSQEREGAGEAAHDSPEHRAWLVDLDGTLYKPLFVKLAMGAELALFGRRHISAIRAFRRQHELIRDAEREYLPSPYEHQLKLAADDCGLPLGELRGVVAEWMVERPGKWIRRFARSSLLEEISAYRRAGGKTALVSDYPASSKLKALGLASAFDTVVSNGEPSGPSRLKPAPDGFLLAAERLDVPPQECLVIGDRKDADGLAASRAGMAFRLIA